VRYQSELEAGNKQMMRRHVEPVREVGGQWPWRVWSGPLRFGDRVYQRGEIISDDLIASCLNGNHLVQSGAVRRMAAPPSKVPPPAPPKPAAEPYVPVDHIKVYFDAMSALAAKRKCPIGDVEDARELIDLQDRAIKQFCNEPQMAMSTAWGGHNRPTPSGEGTSRRIFDPQAFRKRLFSYQEMTK
jgi:hypothetical protein